MRSFYAASSGHPDRLGRGAFAMQDKMMEKPQLLIKPWKIGEPFVYRCSLAARNLLLRKTAVQRREWRNSGRHSMNIYEEVHGCSSAWSSSSPRRNG